MDSERIAKLLELNDFQVMDELQNALISNFNNDKVLIIQEIVDVEELKDTVYKLPQLREKLSSKISNEENLFVVPELHLSKFLWDLYVIGLHLVQNEDDKFDPLIVSKIQRNRFVARKIIIEYQTTEDLIHKFNQLVLPERALNQVLENYKSEQVSYEPLEIDELLNTIEELLNTK
ncbi:ABC-three component system middle component 1 [Paenibacillus cymbidii]|uniref:ABC-three component system middle component 1 n=1 Tax=Paenibacillus cymbidii TaxID=1639034 RepID=UPI001081B439|nr:ABC-three component system middle component 1 [Paenibacillus cymbidii]